MIKQGQYNCILIDGEWVWDGDEGYEPLPVNLPEKPSGQPEPEETTK